MANPFVLDFSPVQNALSQWQKQRQFDQAQQFQSRQFDEGVRQFGVQNALARDRFGLEQAQAGRQDQLFPLQMDQMQAQIEATRRAGANDAKLFPYKLQSAEAEAQLAIAKAQGKDAETMMLRGLFGGRQPQPQGMPPQQPSYQPQSFEGGGGDPMLIPTQAGGGAPPQAQAPPSTVNTPLGPMTVDRARQMGFALGMAGKGDAGKMLTEAAEKDALGKEATNTNDKAQVAAVNSVARLEAIDRAFDPKFLTIPSRINLAAAALADKVGKLDQSKKGELEQFARFRRRAVDNAALTVKDLSGVAVSEAEFARIMTTLPNAGTGIFDGDGPTEFQAKLKDTKSTQLMAIARMNFMRSQGFRGKPWEAGVEIDDMRRIVDRRGAEIEGELRQRGVPAERIGPVIRQRLKQEFGI